MSTEISANRTRYGRFAGRWRRPRPAIVPVAKVVPGQAGGNGETMAQKLAWLRQVGSLSRERDCSAGGKAAHSGGTAHEFTSEEARIAGRKGGRASHARRGKKLEGPDQHLMPRAGKQRSA